MPFRNAADPEQLALLRNALAEICAELGIRDSDAISRNEIAERILWHHGNGVDNLERFKRILLTGRNHQTGHQSAARPHAALTSTN